MRAFLVLLLVAAAFAAAPAEAVEACTPLFQNAAFGAWACVEVDEADPTRVTLAGGGGAQPPETPPVP